MFDDVAITFYNNVVAAYDEYVANRDATSAGQNRHIRSAVTAAIALYHYREHLPDTIKPGYRAAIQACPEYRLIQGVANAGKHKSVDRFDPLVGSAADIRELIVCTRFCDNEGEYSDVQTKVIVACTDGKTQNLDPALTRVLNYWGDLLDSNGLVAFKKRPEKPLPGHIFVDRNDARMGLDLEALQGIDFRQNFQFQEFDQNTGNAVPLNLDGAEVEFQLYKPPRQILDLTMTHPDFGAVTVSLEFTDAENHNYHGLQTDDEREEFKRTIISTRRSELQSLLQAAIIDRRASAIAPDPDHKA